MDTIKQGIHLGNQCNEQIADQIAAKSAQMLDQALQSEFETLLQAKVAIAIQETLNLHAERSSQFAQKFLGTSKSQLAQRLVEGQHENQPISLANHLKLEEFDTNLDLEVSRLADEAGTITIQADATSAVGF